jgi:hypothetical protein
MLAVVENSLHPTRRRKPTAKIEQRGTESTALTGTGGGGKRRGRKPNKRRDESDPDKAVENLSPSESEGKKESKRGVKRRWEKSPTRVFTYDAQWKLAAEIVAREREKREKMLKEKEKMDEDEEDLCELEPLTVLGLQGVNTGEYRTSIDKQNFRNTVATHYYEEAKDGKQSRRLKNVGSHDMVRVLDDPFQPEVTGAKRRKGVFGKLKILDLPSSKPFHRYDAYNLCVSKRDSNGFDQHLLQWFSKPPTGCNVNKSK